MNPGCGISGRRFRTYPEAHPSKIDYNALSEKEDFNMCTLFDEIAKENETKGEAKGIIETGFDFGLSENDILKRLQEKLNLSLQMAQEYIKMFGKQTV